MYRATVVSVDEDGAPSVEVPELGIGYAFGPVEATAPGPWTAGERVLVESVAGILEDVVIVGRINPAADDDGDGEGGVPGEYFEQTFAVPALVWTVPHGLGRLHPEVTLRDGSGGLIFANIVYDTPTHLRVIHDVPSSGAVTVSL